MMMMMICIHISTKGLKTLPPTHCWKRFNHVCHITTQNKKENRAINLGARFTIKQMWLNSHFCKCRASWEMIFEEAVLFYNSLMMVVMKSICSMTYIVGKKCCGDHGTICDNFLWFLSCSPSSSCLCGGIGIFAETIQTRTVFFPILPFPALSTTVSKVENTLLKVAVITMEYICLPDLPNFNISGAII